MELKKLLADQFIDFSEQLEIGISTRFDSDVSECKSFPAFVKEEISFFITLSEMFNKLSDDTFVCASAVVVAQYEITRQRKVMKAFFLRFFFIGWVLEVWLSY
ncbi:hypothetical protein [Pinibacter aurantiacus]|uniref:Uncharacterized protein n=1 Tax=Pinibacter aurantiacus TaxID=2851599 RepID=A0A9E2SB46_9BACT|nr:hypothetical protein [Pinibacter aurantiacus]MBV4359721.1 hypothetical protein [Pinibacter aurantiacus]